MQPILTPPTYQAIPLSPDDKIQVDTIAVTTGINLVIEGSAIDLKGDIVPFSNTININNSITLFVRQFDLGYRYLLSVTARIVGGVVPDGDCYVRLSLVRNLSGGTFPHRIILAQGHCGSRISIGFSIYSNSGYPNEQFFTTNISVTDPAAGAELNFNIPDFTRIEVIAVRATLITSAAVATRIAALVVNVGPGSLHRFNSRGAQVASTTFFYEWYPACSYSGSVNPNDNASSIPYLTMMPNDRLQTNVNGIQAADQWSNFSVLCKRTTIPFA